MDWTNLIEMVDSLREHILYTVKLVEIPLNFQPCRPNDYYTIHQTREKQVWIYGKEEMITFLSDKELFGWEVKCYDFSQVWNEVDRLTITLFKFI